MKRENEDKRPLCIGDNNTCMNLAGLKEKRDDGTWRFHSRCDKHRRRGHDAKAFANPEHKRYIPLNKCDMCNGKAEARHRIISGGAYTPDNITTLCLDCHKKIHRFYTKLKDTGHAITKV